MNLRRHRRARLFWIVSSLIIAPTLLGACAHAPQTLPIVCEERLTPNPEPVFRKLPDLLVEPLPYPPQLPERFTVRDVLLDERDTLYQTLDQANDDRASAKRIVSGDNNDPE